MVGGGVDRLIGWRRLAAVGLHRRALRLRYVVRARRPFLARAGGLWYPDGNRTSKAVKRDE
jgi:hypothetical protein